MNQSNDKNSSAKKVSPVWWWIGWITLTIATFFVSCFFWTKWIAQSVGPMDKPGTPIIWVVAVFGTWMALLVPLIIVMYNKVDRTYEDARISHEAQDQARLRKKFAYKTTFVAPEERALPKTLTAKLKKIPAALNKGHLVCVKLKDGRQFDHVFIYNKKEVLGIYDQDALPFRIDEIVDLEPMDLERLPAFSPSKWLRLDLEPNSAV